jgi:uncharacterized membrane protein HdeD (DUF308 family)
MFCKVCGLNIDDNAKSCPNCGAAFMNDPYAQSVITEPSVMVQPTSTNDGLAVASLVLGIVSASFSIICCLPYVTAILGFLCAIVGLILGIFALKTKKRTQAIVGLSLSAVAIVVSVVVIIFWTVVFLNADHTNSGSQTNDFFEYEFSQFEKN